MTIQQKDHQCDDHTWVFSGCITTAVNSHIDEYGQMYASSGLFS